MVKDYFIKSHIVDAFESWIVEEIHNLNKSIDNCKGKRNFDPCFFIELQKLQTLKDVLAELRQQKLQVLLLLEH